MYLRVRAIGICVTKSGHAGLKYVRFISYWVSSYLLKLYLCMEVF
jgi:hypothetical protein